MGDTFNTRENVDDIVLSTRIRIARNLSDYKFPEIINLEESDRLTTDILNSIKNNFEDNYSFHKMENIEINDRKNFIEDHLISPRLIKKPEMSSFLLKDDKSVSIMINEEDHLRIQSFLPGFDLDAGWNIVNEIDNKLEKELDYAFDEDLGYLTSCPTNIGTGLRVSAMVHLPALTVTGYINSLINELNKIGLTVRGIYGEGSSIQGNLYQISNQITLGESEETIIKKIRGIIFQIIDRERELRNFLLLNRRDEFEDRVFRSYGILRNARIISSKEAMEHISNIRIGIAVGLINNIEFDDINKLIISIQPAHIQNDEENILDKKERDIKRAGFIRNALKCGEVI